MIGQRWRRGALALGLALAGLAGACDKNPVDAAIELALDFDGYFRAEDGTEIELDGSTAIIRKVGSAVLGTQLDVGDPYMMSMYPTGTPGEFRGYVIDRSGLLGQGTVQIDGSTLTVTGRSGTAPTGQTNWQKTTPPSTTPPPPSSGTNPPPPSGSVTTVISESGLQGDERSKRRWYVDVPAGVKELRVTTGEDNAYGGNLGDVFVSRGAEPDASHHPYTWTAGWKSIEPNRTPDVVPISNPEPGRYHILLYGYHAYWGTTLKVTITR